MVALAAVTVPVTLVAGTASGSGALTAQRHTNAPRVIHTQDASKAIVFVGSTTATGQSLATNLATGEVNGVRSLSAPALPGLPGAILLTPPALAKVAPTTTTTTTVVPAPTTTVAPAPKPVAVTAPAPAPAAAPAVTGGGYADPANPATWDRLAQCESHGNWADNTGNGYYGGLQFSLGTWHAMGGTGRPDQASREVQIEIGQRLQARSGWGQWPGCTRALHYR
jgi:hypothetical protein